jgi:hypothetical protein
MEIHDVEANPVKVRHDWRVLKKTAEYIAKETGFLEAWREMREGGYASD